MLSQPENVGVIRKLVRDVTKKTITEAQAVVDKSYPEMAVIRKNIWPRLYNLKHSYANLTPQQMTLEKVKEQKALKAAWEKDYNLLDKRDMEQWLGSPLGVSAGLSIVGAGCGAAGRTAAEAIFSPLLTGRTLLTSNPATWTSVLKSAALRTVCYTPAVYFVSRPVLHVVLNRSLAVLDENLEVKRLSYKESVTPDQLWKDRLTIFTSFFASATLVPFNDAAEWNHRQGVPDNLRAFISWPPRMGPVLRRTVPGALAGLAAAAFLPYWPSMLYQRKY